MNRIGVLLKKNTWRGVLIAMLAIVLLRIGGADAAALTQNCGQWSVISSPNVGTAANVLYGITAISPNDVWAVGTSTNATLTEHWNGTQWSVVPSLSSGTNPTLSSVTAISTKNVWAVGYSGTYPNYQALIEHWNGKKWKIVSGPNTGATLFGVAAVAKNDIWAVGTIESGGPSQSVIEHWNGKRWSVVTSPNPSNSSLYSVAAISTDDVWAVGSSGDDYDALTEHWDGTNWSLISNPPPPLGGCIPVFYGITAIASNDVWAVGANFTDCYSPPWVSLTEHWDGTQWNVIPSPSGLHSSILTGVAAASANDAWAVGNYLVGQKQGYVPLTYHWDGTSWTQVTNPSLGNSQLNSVAATAGTFWAVGEFVPKGGTNQTLIEFYC